MKKIFLGLMACAALCACTSDDLVSLGNETQKVFQGDVAYMTVSIKDVGSGTRATSPTDSPFINGTEEEYAVGDAYFYFYDDAGVFVSEAEVWDGGEATEPHQNVEFEGETVIILKGLTSKNYPTHVVTVLNKPSNFQPGETLDEMQTLLANATDVLYSNGNFVMSTSSYDAGTTSEGTAVNDYYFTTALSEDDFYEEPVTDWGSSTGRTPVDIYVERLAAKITVGVGDLSNETSTYTDEDSNEYTSYKINETIAGDPNEEDVETGGDNGEVRDGMGTEDVYVAFLGWTTNAVARNSYMMKNLDLDTWSTTAPFTGWNDATDHRSYWGMSWNYGDENADYPVSANGNTPTDEELSTTWLNDYLLYKNLQNPTSLNEGDNLYCEYVGENTNTADVLGSKYSSGITSVLIKAVACDVDGNALDLVRYNGELFTQKDYLNYVMSELTATGKLNIYTSTYDETTQETTYTHIDGSYIELSDSYTDESGQTVTLTDGLVAVVVAEDAFSSSETYYAKQDDGTFEAITPETGTTVADMVTAQLDEFNATANANAFTGGLMYYSIPIEHLNNTYGENIAEANYGVVRNHCYSLTITELANMGKGIYNPDEVIVPEPEEEPTYYVGATINILSWKLVDQQVSL